MPSDNALNLVNRVLRTTGDYQPLSTVVNSPAGIAERIIDYLNLVVEDLDRKIDWPVLYSSFIGTGDGAMTVFMSSGIPSSVNSAISCTIDRHVATEISRKALLEKRAQFPTAHGEYYFYRMAGVNNELGVDIYPAPANGSQVIVASTQRPTRFTVDDNSTTEIAADDLLVLGALGHLDAYDGVERGYFQLYEAEKNRMWTYMNSNSQYRVEPESYR